MFKFILNLFRKKPASAEDMLQFPEGKRYYKETHNLRKNMMDDDAIKIIYRLNKFGHKAFLVGGCIRDLLLGRKPKDFDIVTSATPNQIRNIFNNCRIIGKRFKIVHVIFKGKVIEVSTFRSLPDHRLEPVNKKTDGKDKDYLLKKDNNYGTPKEDVARRDFTVNSLYYDPRNESLIDFVGGYEDVKNKIVRVVGDPEISFKEDPVRMLRAVKISVMHGMQIEKKTKAAIKNNRFEMEKASPSRMLEEYNKIIRTWDSANILKGLAENFLLEVLFKDALSISMKNPRWREEFLNLPIGRRLQIADRKLKEREDIPNVVFYALLFSEVVEEALSKEKGNKIPIIKQTLDSITRKMELPKREKDILVKIYASQKRFLRKEEDKNNHNESFKTKDFFYESFIYFKINAEANNDEEAIQTALYWEISSRMKARQDEKKAGEEKKKTHHQNNFNNGKNNKNFPKDKNRPHHQKDNKSLEKKEESVKEEIPVQKEETESKQTSENSGESKHIHKPRNKHERKKFPYKKPEENLETAAVQENEVSADTVPVQTEGQSATEEKTEEGAPKAKKFHKKNRYKRFRKNKFNKNPNNQNNGGQGGGEKPQSGQSSEGGGTQ